MKSISLRDCGFLAREVFTALILSVLFLVTGCSSNDYTPRAALAPPPPFMASVQSYGPPVPVEIAMARMMDSIMPAAGSDMFTVELPQASAERKCLVGSKFTSDDGHIGFGVNDSLAQSSEHRFSSLHNSGAMTLRFTVALPSPVKKTISCD